MSLKRCNWTNCPNLISKTKRYCPQHAAAYERQRGTTTQRGYGTHHQTLRQHWANLLAQGVTHTCAKCGQPVTSADQWDLGHTENRQGYTGPEHARCNRSAGAQNSNKMREHWKH